LAGLTFSLGLILVVVAGAEPFTGNNLIVLAWAKRKVSSARLVRNWAIVYLGNMAGALATAGILFVGKQYTFGKGAVGEQALSIAAGETSLGFVHAIVPPIAAFVAAGFEHSVANMFFIPMGLLVKTDSSFVAQHPVAGLSHLTWGRFVGANLVPVTLGNVIGGALMVGAIYWFVYLRNARDATTAASAAAARSLQTGIRETP
jgi:formate transporter